MKTTWLKSKEIERKWQLIDAEGQILGRLSSEIAKILIGKGKVEAVPNLDCGDFVVVVNAEKIKVTGKKMKDKKYFWHTGFPGGLNERSLEQLLDSKPEKVIWYAVRNMLPQNKLRDGRMSRLKIHAGSEHPHKAQKPKKVELIS